MELSIERRVRAAIELLLRHPNLRSPRVDPPRLLRDLLIPMDGPYDGESPVNDNSSAWSSDREDSSSGA